MKIINTIISFPVLMSAGFLTACVQPDNFFTVAVVLIGHALSGACLDGAMGRLLTNPIACCR